MDSWFLAAVKGSLGNEMMVADDPMRRLCLGRLKNIPAQAVCVLLVILQAFFLNYHLVTSLNNYLHWLWFIADAVVIAALIASFYLKEWRLNHVAVRHKEENDFSKGLPYASLGWFVYALVLSVRVCMIFVYDVHDRQEIADLKLSICITAIICIFFTWGHHHSYESLARRASILSLVKMFTIDLLDTVDVLDVLFITATQNPDTFPVALEVIVLAIVTLNLIRPTVTLVSLFIDHYGSHVKSLKVKIAKSLFELFLLNIPLMVVRSYIAATYGEAISVFLVKNLLGILFGIVEIYDCSYDIYTERSNTTDRTELSSIDGRNGVSNAAHNNNASSSNGEKVEQSEEQDKNTHKSTELTI